MGSSQTNTIEALGTDITLSSNESIGFLSKYTGKFRKITVVRTPTDASPLPVYTGKLTCGAALLDLRDASLVQVKLLCALLDTQAPTTRMFDSCIFPMSLLCRLASDLNTSCIGSDGIGPLSRRISEFNLYGIEHFLTSNKTADLLFFKEEFKFLFCNTQVCFHVKDSVTVQIIGSFSSTLLLEVTESNTPKVVFHSVQSISGASNGSTDFLIEERLR